MQLVGRIIGYRQMAEMALCAVQERANEGEEGPLPWPLLMTLHTHFPRMRLPAHDIRHPLLQSPLAPLGKALGTPAAEPWSCDLQGPCTLGSVVVPSPFSGCRAPDSHSARSNWALPLS